MVQPLLDGHCRIAVIGSFPEVPAACAAEYLLGVQAATMVAPGHPLARVEGTVMRSEAARHVQLVLTDRSSLTRGRDFGVLSPRVWRLADLGAKHAFLRAGLGWGNMPLHMVEQDLHSGTLVRIELETHAVLGAGFSMHALFMKDQPPGPAGRWFIEHLKSGA